VIYSDVERVEIHFEMAKFMFYTLSNEKKNAAGRAGPQSQDAPKLSRKKDVISR
jgi:hypothetical protein